MSDETNQILIDAMSTPKSASGDGNSATARDAGELIALDEYLTKKSAAANSRSKSPFKTFREILPGPA